MKKIILALLTSVILTSCVEIETPFEQNDNNDNYNGFMYINDGNNPKKMKIYSYTYNNHLYQYHYFPQANATHGGPVHDPDCPCHKTKSSDIANE